jgi:hypothetical protein
MSTDPFQVALRVAEALEACGVRYLTGGSLASSMSGEPRSSLDIDLVVALTRATVAPFLASLGDDFYADREAIGRAVDERSSANIIHLPTSMKIDLFIMGGTPLDEEQMGRRRRVRVASDPDRFLYVYTPEDILLQKLRWYRLSGSTSERQWRDISGIVRVQNESLDTVQLRHGASILGVSDLLEAALRENSTQ